MVTQSRIADRQYTFPIFDPKESKVRLLSKNLHRLPEHKRRFAIGLVHFYKTKHRLSDSQYIWVLKLLQSLHPFIPPSGVN